MINMTEKRFTIEEWDIWDYADSVLVIFQNGEFISNKDVVDLLNEQHEENHSLKFQLDECRNHKLFSRRELEKENEQLKGELRNLRRLANELYMEGSE